MNGDIRVRVDGRYFKLYNDLRDSVGEASQVFYLCACLGYRTKRATPLGHFAEPKFFSKNITPSEWSCYCAMILDEQNMDFSALNDDKAVVERIEQYANGGMAFLIEECLCDHIVGPDSDPRLDSSSSKELPRVLLGFSLEQLDEERVAVI